MGGFFPPKLSFPELILCFSSFPGLVRLTPDMQLSENMDQAKDSDADCLPGMGEEEVGEEDERQAEDEDDGEEREGAEGHEDIRDMAMVALGLLKQEVKVMLQQVKQLVKTNPQLASQVSAVCLVWKGGNEGGWGGTPYCFCCGVMCVCVRMYIYVCACDFSRACVCV